MNNRDKVIAAFLVSVGLFSTAQSAEYVSTLSEKDKGALISVATDQSGTVKAADGAEIFQENKNQK